MIKSFPCILVFTYLLGGCAPGKKDIKNWERNKDIENLITVLKDPQSPYRTLAAASLGTVGDSRAVEPLLTTLEKDGIELQIASVSALGKIGGKEGVDSLISFLRKGYSGISSAPQRGKGPPPKRGPPQKIKQERSGESFDAYQKKVFARARLRLEAVRALGRIGNQRAVDILSGAIWDGRSEEVSIAAVEALAKLGGKNSAKDFSDAFGTCNFRIREIAAAALANFQPPPKETLYKVLENENPCFREGAVQAIGLIGETKDVERLIQALSDKNYGVRLQASAALAHIGKASVPALLRALKSSPPSTRKVAARTLGIIGDPRSIPFLKQTLGDESLPVRKTAAAALYELNNKKKRKDPLPD